MKLSRILPLVVGGAVAGIVISSASPAQALTYNWNYTGLSNTSGTFDQTGGTITSFTGTVGGTAITGLLPIGTIIGGAGVDNLFPLTGRGVGFSTASDTFAIYFSGGLTSIWQEGLEDIIGTGVFNATPVPFDIPGGATIPTVGSLFALGLMRKAKKRLAAKTL
ncbi:hypothetical protein, partial [Trichormus sp. NMC-1]